LLGHQLVELSVLDEFGDDIDASHELLVDEDLGEGGPVAVDLEPLADSLVVQDVEGLVLVVGLAQGGD